MNYIKAFESHFREQGKAEKTIQSYTGDNKGLKNQIFSSWIP